MAGRSDFGQERYECVQIQQSVTDKFDQVFAKENNENVITINSSRGIEEIANEIADIVRDFILQRSWLVRRSQSPPVISETPPEDCFVEKDHL